MNYRRQVVEALIPYFREDERYILLVGDMGFGAIDTLTDEFPDRIINCGIMEQGTTGIAAGMSMTGLIPIFYSIVNFLVFRSIEQIRNDVVKHNLNVKFIGTGANDYFEFLGSSHCCGQEDIEILNTVGLQVYDPYTSEKSFEQLFDQWIRDEHAGYIRV